MNIIEQVNQMGKVGLSEFIRTSMAQRPDMDGPEGSDVLTVAAITLTGVDYQNIDELMEILLNPEMRELSGAANRGFIIGLRLAQHLVGSAMDSSDADAQE